MPHPKETVLREFIKPLTFGRNMKSQKSKGGSRLLSRIWTCLRQKHTSLSTSYQTDASVEEENPPTTAKHHFLSFFPPLLSLHLLSLFLHVMHVSPLSPCVVSKICRGSISRGGKNSRGWTEEKEKLLNWLDDRRPTNEFWSRTRNLFLMTR